METKLIILCLLGHVLGDYYFQTMKLAHLKTEKIRGLILHGLFYSIPYFIIMLLVEHSNKLILIFFIIVGIHFIIDSLKFVWIKFLLKKKKNHLLTQKEWLIYLVDQGLHLLTIVLICFYIGKLDVRPIKTLQDFLIFYRLESINTLKWILLVLFINKPINITFGKMFSSYKPIIEEESNNNKENIILHTATIERNKKNTYNNSKKLNNENTDTRKAGAIIGFLERALIIIFLNIGQYSAIGLILTAKSIARYEMISKNQEFGEYYLIGTLTSVLSSVIAYHIIFTWL